MHPMSDDYLTAWAVRWAQSVNPQAQISTALIQALGSDLVTVLRLASLVPEMGLGVPTLLKALELVARQGGMLHIGLDNRGRWFADIEWGQEAPDSPMAGAAAYSHQASTFLGALGEMAAGAGLDRYAATLPPASPWFGQPDEDDTDPQTDLVEALWAQLRYPQDPPRPVTSEFSAAVRRGLEAHRRKNPSIVLEQLDQAMSQARRPVTKDED